MAPDNVSLSAFFRPSAVGGNRRRRVMKALVVVLQSIHKKNEKN